VKTWVLALAIGITCQSAFGVNLDVCSTCTYTTIQDAIIHSGSGDQIRIAGGTYNEDLSFYTSSFNVGFQGGYNSTFTARNAETILNGGISISASSASAVAIDGLTIINSSSSGIYTSGTAADLTVTNCKIHGAASYGIYAYNPGNITIDGSEIYSNVGGGVAFTHLSAGKSVSITNNTIHSNDHTFSPGISMSIVSSDILVQGNLIYGNNIGIYMLAGNGAPSPVIANNRIYENAAYGIMEGHASPIIKNNYFYRNGTSGIYNYSVDSPLIINNLFASNGPYGYGVELSIGSGAPVIKNNIFYYEFHGLYMDTGIAVVPSLVSHNAFFHDQILDYRDLHTGNSEIPGDYNDINHFSWANSNLVIDPRFVDPDNDDYTLGSDSFLIDEGDPGTDFSLESAPNGGRVNIGPQGGTSAANTAQAAPSISNISATQSGDDIAVTFDTNTASHALWLKLEYYDGSAYQPIAPSGVSGDEYEIGYYSGRVASGAGRGVLWHNAAATFGLGSATTRIRATVEHGLSSASTTTTDISLDFTPPAPTPTETPTGTPTEIPSPSPSPSPTVSATPTPTLPPNDTPSPSLSPSPTVTPTAPPKKPTIKAKNARTFVGARIRLPIRVQDSDSASVAVAVTLKLALSKNRALKRNFGSFAVALPAHDPFELDIGKRTLARGAWTYCVQARDTALTSARSCAALLVQARAPSRKK